MAFAPRSAPAAASGSVESSGPSPTRLMTGRRTVASSKAMTGNRWVMASYGLTRSNLVTGREPMTGSRSVTASAGSDHPDTGNRLSGVRVPVRSTCAFTSG